eukprot:1159211-Pelagomonas_calceolata.AAC.21
MAITMTNWQVPCICYPNSHQSLNLAKSLSMGLAKRECPLSFEDAKHLLPVQNIMKSFRGSNDCNWLSVL